MKPAIATVVFIQDGKTLQDAACFVEAGAVLKGHVYVSLGATVRCLRLALALNGHWRCVWRPRPPVFDPHSGEALTPIIEGNMEAAKAVAAVSQDVYEGTLLRGEHGIPAVISIPVSAPPSLDTPKNTEKLGLFTSPVPMHAKCSYTLTVTATCSTLEGGDEIKKFVIPVTVMAPSGLRAAVLRNQPRPLTFSNAGHLAVPCSVSEESAKVSPFSFPRRDPLDPILRTLDPPADVRHIVDKNMLLYDLDVSRLHHYIGDQIPFTMAIKPKPPLYIDTRIHSITASLITHIHFQLPSKLPDYQRPPSAAIAVRLHTETWNNSNASISDLFDPMGAPQPRRFHFTIPEDAVPCPSLPDTAQNKLPIEILHILRISVRVSNLSSVAETLDQLQPLSAVRVGEQDVLVLDVPVVLVSKGNQIYSWGLPRVPRGWRVGQMVAAIADSMATKKEVSSQSGSGGGSSGGGGGGGEKKGESGIIVKATSYSDLSAYSPTSASSPSSPKPLQKRSSRFFGSVFGKPGPSVSAQKHPKFTAEELNKMAQDAMMAGIEEEAEKKKNATSIAVEAAVVAVPEVSTAAAVAIEEVESEVAIAAEAVEIEVAAVLDPVLEVSKGMDIDSSLVVTATSTARRLSIITIPIEDASPEAIGAGLLSPQWEVQNKPINDAEAMVEEEEDPACVVPVAAVDGTQPSVAEVGVNDNKNNKKNPIPQVTSDDFHSDPVSAIPINQEHKKEDQMKKELEHGLDEQGRFLPLNEFSGRYRVIYPYLEGLRRDEIKLSIGDIVDVQVSYVDGWAKGVNRNTGDEGFVPLHCLLSQNNTAVEDGRPLGKWFNESISHQIDIPNDWRFLCQYETRFNLIKDGLTTYRPLAGSAEVEMPPSAHVAYSHRRGAKLWVEHERCFRCYSQAGPLVWEG
ncbi:hypothetical protein BDR26DRAFT_868649 [Obelidium mucronatum]|nr:hypothetical protein BDR26DRAFT_868649 [Obelidium mucronatum]